MVEISPQAKAATKRPKRKPIIAPHADGSDNNVSNTFGSKVCKNCVVAKKNAGPYEPKIVK